MSDDPARNAPTEGVLMALVTRCVLGEEIDSGGTRWRVEPGLHYPEDPWRMVEVTADGVPTGHVVHMDVRLAAWVVPAPDPGWSRLRPAPADPPRFVPVPDGVLSGTLLGPDDWAAYTDALGDEDDVPSDSVEPTGSTGAQQEGTA